MAEKDTTVRSVFCDYCPDGHRGYWVTGHSAWAKCFFAQECGLNERIEEVNKVIQVMCDHCKKPITDVVYGIAPAAPDNLNPIRYPTQLHYDCIVPWREKDR